MITTRWFTEGKQQGLNQSKVNSSLAFVQTLVTEYRTVKWSITTTLQPKPECQSLTSLTNGLNPEVISKLDVNVLSWPLPTRAFQDQPAQRNRTECMWSVHKNLLGGGRLMRNHFFWRTPTSALNIFAEKKSCRSRKNEWNKLRQKKYISSNEHIDLLRDTEKN